jgi:hypothetical protein
MEIDLVDRGPAGEVAHGRGGEASVVARSASRPAARREEALIVIIGVAT